MRRRYLPYYVFVVPWFHSSYSFACNVLTSLWICFIILSAIRSTQFRTTFVFNVYILFVCLYYYQLLKRVFQFVQNRWVLVNYNSVMFNGLFSSFVIFKSLLLDNYMLLFFPAYDYLFINVFYRFLRGSKVRVFTVWRRFSRVLPNLYTKSQGF